MTKFTFLSAITVASLMTTSHAAPLSRRSNVGIGNGDSDLTATFQGAQLPSVIEARSLDSKQIQNNQKPCDGCVLTLYNENDPILPKMSKREDTSVGIGNDDTNTKLDFTGVSGDIKITGRDTTPFACARGETGCEDPPRSNYHFNDLNFNTPIESRSPLSNVFCARGDNKCQDPHGRLLSLNAPITAKRQQQQNMLYNCDGTNCVNAWDPSNTFSEKNPQQPATAKRQQQENMLYHCDGTNCVNAWDPSNTFSEKNPQQPATAPVKSNNRRDYSVGIGNDDTNTHLNFDGITGNIKISGR